MLSFFSTRPRPSLVSSGPVLSSLSELVVLNPIGPVAIHWTDYNEACDHYRERLKTDRAFLKSFEEMKSTLLELRHTPVWLRRGGALVHSNLHDLYVSFVREQAHGDAPFDPHEPLDISFVSPSGPFRRMAITECFNVDTYQSFVLVALLRGELPERDFRVRLRTKLLLEHGPQLADVAAIELEQLSSSGLLLKMPNGLYLKHLRSSEKMRLLLNADALVLKQRDWQHFRELTGGWGQHPLFTQQKSHGILLSPESLVISARFDFAATRELYVFLPFDAIAKSRPEVHQRLQHFVQAGKSGVKTLLKSELKSA